MTEITIEPYSEQYKNDIQKLILEIQQQEFQIDVDIQRQPDLLNISNFYQMGSGNFWIARRGDSVIGTISLLDIENDQAALRKMFVHRNYRGKEHGVGQRLLQTLLDWAKTKMIKDIFLGTTAKFIAAHRFYEKHGFESIDKSELPEKFPIMSVDVRFYRIKI